MSKSLQSQSLENYLSQIEWELRALPSQARADELREIEAHLSALVQASGQLEEMSKAEATATALRQFGAPRTIGKKLRKAWERKQPEAWWRAGIALLVGLLIYASSGLLIKEFSIFYLSSYNVDINVLQHTITDFRLGNIVKTLVLYQATIAYSILLITGYVSSVISLKRGFVAILPIPTLSLFWEIESLLSDDHGSVFGVIFRTTLRFLLIAIGAYFGKKSIQKIASRRANAN